MNPRRSFWFPSLSASIWLAFFLALCLSDWRLVLISADGDPSLHWRIGDWMIEHRQIIEADQFSHTKPGARLISKEWLSEVIVASASNLLGWNGAVILAAALIATLLWGLHRLLLAEGCDVLLATLLVLLAALAMSHHWLARPHLVTHLFTLVLIWKLRALERGTIRPVGFFVCLVPLMILWTNLHGAFFTGFILLGVCAIANSLQSTRRLTLWLAFGVAILVSFINPNTWQLHAHILAFIREPLLAGYVSEFRSPNFHSEAMTGFMVLLLVLLLMLVVVRPKLGASDLLLLGAWGYFSLHSVRNIPILAIIAAPLLGEHWSAWLRRRRDEEGRTTWHRTSERLAQLHRRAGGAGLVMLTVAAMIFLMGRGSLKSELLPTRFPVAALEFLRSNPNAVGARMFNAYGWGGYLMLELPQHPLFVDSRNDFYGADFMREFDVPDEVKHGWETVLDKYQVDWTILPFDHPLNRVLELHPAWRETYRDQVTMMFKRRGDVGAETR